MVTTQLIVNIVNAMDSTPSLPPSDSIQPVGGPLPNNKNAVTTEPVAAGELVATTDVLNSRESSSGIPMEFPTAATESTTQSQKPLHVPLPDQEDVDVPALELQSFKMTQMMRPMMMTPKVRHRKHCHQDVASRLGREHCHLVSSSW